MAISIALPEHSTVKHLINTFILMFTLTLPFTFGVTVLYSMLSAMVDNLTQKIR